MKYSLMIWAGQGGQLDIVSGHVKFYADIGKRLRKNLNLIKPRNLTEFARLKKLQNLQDTGSIFPSLHCQVLNNWSRRGNRQ